MSNVGVATSTRASSAATTSKAAAKKIAAKKPAAKPAHPPVSEMVIAAITALKNKKGSSLQAIKKYIAATYKLDMEKQSTYIKKYLKAAVAKKTIVQTKGTGASGSFRLAAKAAKGGNEKEIVKKPTVKKSAIEKIRSSKKPVVAKKPAANKTPAPRKVLFIKCKASSYSIPGKAATAAKPKSLSAEAENGGNKS